MILVGVKEAELVVIGEEVGIRFDVAFVISGLKVAVVVHAVEGAGLVLDMIDEEDTFKVVDFVEQGAGEIAFSLEADLSAVGELGFDFDFFRTRDEAVDFGDGETALVIGLGFAFGFDDFGVDEGSEGILGLIFKIIAYDDDTLVDTELGGSHGGRKFVGVLFLPVERSGGHIGDDLVSFVSNFADATRLLAQARIRGGNHRFESRFHGEDYNINGDNREELE